MVVVGGGCHCLRSVCVSVRHLLNLEPCAVLSRAFSRASDPLPAVWPSLGSGGSCLQELRALSSQRARVQSSGAVLLNATIAGKSLASPTIAHSPRGLGAARLCSRNCFPHPGLDHCLQTLLWLPPGRTNSFLLFSQETVNPFVFPGPASLDVWGKICFPLAQ